MSHASVPATFVVLCLCASTLHAQTAAPPAQLVTSAPRLVRVDGVFVPANGLPLAPVEVVTLAIYASPVDGSPLWQETQDVAVDAAGRYAIFLGATAVDGLPVRLFASEEPRWLGLRFARPGEDEKARVLDVFGAPIPGLG